VPLQGRQLGDLPFFKVADISDAWKRGTCRLEGAKNYLTRTEALSLKARPLPAGSIVFAKIGEAISLNRRAVLAQPSLVDNNCMGIWCDPDCLDQTFLFHLSCTIRFGEMSRASVVPSIRKSDVERVAFLLPPLAEQHRIVTKIEELFSDLDAGVSALDRVRRNLKRYRAAVLKAAVEGRLTEKWRQEYPPAEPASKLVERILIERRKKWEQDQLAKYAAAGKPPPRNWREKYQEPLEPDATTLPALPVGWQWTTLDAITEVAGGITKGQRYAPGTVLREVAYLRVANVQRGFLDLTDMKAIPATEAEISDLRLRNGDILFTEGGDRDKLGRGWVWNGEIPECIHQNHVFRARQLLPDVEARFISYHGNFFGQEWFRRTGKQTVNLASINMTVLKRFPVPIPPVDEQMRIVAEVERRLSVANAVEAEIAADSKRAARLRQSILRQAFDGKLVPQDPADEPASALLERIKTQLATSAAESNGRKSRKGRAERTHVASNDGVFDG
jgi:type I restriction enzyme S subunit